MLETFVIDEGDVYKIPRVDNSSFSSSCSGQFFFFDWNDEFIFISKENDKGIIKCQGSKGAVLYFSNNLSDEEQKSLLE